MNRINFSIIKHTNIDLEIPYPMGAKLFVNVGDKVQYGQRLYEFTDKKILDSYYLPDLLGIRPEKSQDFVGRVNGEFVSEGELLAEKLATGGLVTKKIISAVDGVVSLKRLGKGYLDIVSEDTAKSVESKFSGVLEDIYLGSHLHFKVDTGAISFACSNIKQSEPMIGELVIVGTGESVYTPKDLNESYEGKVVYVGRYLYHNLLSEIYKRGAVLVITNSMDYFEFREAQEDVLIMKGFGQVEADQDIEQILHTNVGNKVIIDVTKFLMHITNGKGLELETYTGKTYVTSTIESGQNIKITTPSNYGRMGTVIEEIDDNRFTVELSDSKRVVVPPSELIVWVSI